MLGVEEEEEEEIVVTKYSRKISYLDNALDREEEQNIPLQETQAIEEQIGTTQEALFNTKNEEDVDLPTATAALDKFVDSFGEKMGVKESIEVHREAEQLIRDYAPKLEVKSLKKKSLDDVIAKIQQRSKTIAVKMEESEFKIDFNKEAENEGNVFLATHGDTEYIDLIIEPPEKQVYKPPLMLGSARKKPSILALNEDLKKKIKEDKQRRIKQALVRENETQKDEEEQHESSEVEVQSGAEESFEEAEDEENRSMTPVEIEELNVDGQKDKLLMFLSGNFESEKKNEAIEEEEEFSSSDDESTEPNPYYIH